MLAKTLKQHYLDGGLKNSALRKVEAAALEAGYGDVYAETCFYVETEGLLTPKQCAQLRLTLSGFRGEGLISGDSRLGECGSVIELGPRLTWETSFSSTSRSIFANSGLKEITRAEKSVRIGLTGKLSKRQKSEFLAVLSELGIYDEMTQEPYERPLRTFHRRVVTEPVRIIRVLEEGEAAIRRENEQQGLAMDEADIAYWADYSQRHLLRNPTDVELFTEATETSEHCDHPRWKGEQEVDGRPLGYSLFDEAERPMERNPGNTRSGFGDESSSLSAPRSVPVFLPSNPTTASVLIVEQRLYHPSFTAESHNAPSMWCPEQGAGTAEARIRDVICQGRGGKHRASGGGILVSHLHIPGYTMEWEKADFWENVYGAQALQIAIEARNGSFFFGNAVGDPKIHGFFDSMLYETAEGLRTFHKPYVYTVGYGYNDERHVDKWDAQIGDILVVFGGLNYPVGMGGGVYSSLDPAAFGDLSRMLGLKSVQRMAPEMQQRGVRVVAGAVDLGDNNPFRLLKDSGAGGLCTMLMEILKQIGGYADYWSIPTGDPTMSIRVGFGNEHQESQGGLVIPERFETFKALAERFSCPWAAIGKATGSGRFVLIDSKTKTNPVDLPLKPIFERPKKLYQMETVVPQRTPVTLPKELTPRLAMERVFRQAGVACKRWLTDHVDKCVGGYVVGQSLQGPQGIPVGNYGLTVLSPLDTLGDVHSLSVKPRLGLNNPEAMANMTVWEVFANAIGCPFNLADAGICINWGSALKDKGEGVVVNKAARAGAEALIALKTKQLGGKDSSGLKSKAKNKKTGQEVDSRAPVTMILSLTAPVEDVRVRVSPVTEPGQTLLHIDMSANRKRLGGSVVAQVYGQLGDETPNVSMYRAGTCLNLVAALIRDGSIQMGHDISDGGLMTTLAEVAFAGGCGIEVRTSSKFSALKFYYAEEAGFVIGCRPADAERIRDRFRKSQIACNIIGKVTGRGGRITMVHNNRWIVDDPMTTLRQIWMETSFKLDAIDASPDAIVQEQQVMSKLVAEPHRHMTYTAKPTVARIMGRTCKPRALVGPLFPGINGDNEYKHMLHLAGFEVWEGTDTDILEGRLSLDDFQFLGLPGGFSFQDVIMSGVGIAAVASSNAEMAAQFHRFFVERTDTASLAICNYCQAMTALGMVPFPELKPEQRPRFYGNDSEQFQSSYVSVRIEQSPAIMFQKMVGSTLGVWVAHGEGKLTCDDDQVLQRLLNENLIPLRYVDETGQPTQLFPFNPNGSFSAAAALCTPNGRHVVSMPHPERDLFPWYIQWLPRKWRQLQASYWLQPFQTIREWCEKQGKPTTMRTVKSVKLVA